MDSYGVTKVGVTGEDFNHEIHEPIESITVDDQSKDNTIQEVVRSGYKMNETIIRPAHVKVGSFEKDE
jgi:molecular chaperone GrpE (heat shock protein)